MKFSFESPQKKTEEVKQESVKNPETDKKVIGKNLKNLVMATGAVLAMMPAIAQKTKNTKEKNIHPKEFTDLAQYEKAKQKYEDSLRLHNESYGLLKKVSGQLGVKPKIKENYYDPFSSLFSRNHPDLFFLGTENERQIKELVGPGAPTSIMNGNGDKLILKDESLQSIKDKVHLAKAIRNKEKGKNGISHFKSSDTLFRYGIFQESNKMKVEKTTKKYSFNQVCHPSISPNRKAEFNIGSNYSLWSKEKKAKNPDVIEEEHTRSTSDEVFMQEIKKSDKDNLIKYIFGNNNADGSKFYIYSPSNYSSNVATVYLYDKPTQAVVYKTETQKDTLVIHQKPILERALDSVGKNPLPEIKETIYKPELKGDIIYGPSNGAIGYMNEGRFTPIGRMDHLQGGTPKTPGANKADIDLLKNNGALYKYLKEKYGAYFKGIEN